MGHKHFTFLGNDFQRSVVKRVQDTDMGGSQCIRRISTYVVNRIWLRRNCAPRCQCTKLTPTKRKHRYFNIAIPSGCFFSSFFAFSSSRISIGLVSLGLTWKNKQTFLDDSNARIIQSGKKYEATVSLVGKYIYVYIYIYNNEYDKPQSTVNETQK